MMDDWKEAILREIDRMPQYRIVPYYGDSLRKPPPGGIIGTIPDWARPQKNTCIDGSVSPSPVELE